mmetsp:Transcript_115320/g.288144  ORF Transcript_115320/g.288144 Transcript_115320/m.288144 type:complete len:253 (-) Transcript_115320:1993-2751(-)
MSILALHLSDTLFQLGFHPTQPLSQSLQGISIIRLTTTGTDRTGNPEEMVALRLFAPVLSQREPRALQPSRVQQHLQGGERHSHRHPPTKRAERRATTGCEQKPEQKRNDEADQQTNRQHGPTRLKLLHREEVLAATPGTLPQKIPLRILFQAVILVAVDCDHEVMDAHADKHSDDQKDRIEAQLLEGAAVAEKHALVQSEHVPRESLCRIRHGASKGDRAERQEHIEHHSRNSPTEEGSQNGRDLLAEIGE